MNKGSSVWSERHPGLPERFVMLKFRRGSAALAALLSIFVAEPAVFGESHRDEKVLIQVPKPYTQTVAGILSLGGKVTRQFQNIDAIAAEVPEGSMQALRSLVGSGAISKDEPIPMPRSVLPLRKKPPSPRGAAPQLQSALSSSDPDYDPYLLNMAGLNLQSLHKKGMTGDRVVVAVIDTGMRPGFAIDTAVLACENFVDDNGDGIVDGRDNRCMDSRNNPHGTFVAGLIASRPNTDFDLTGTDLLLSIQQWAPTALKKNSRGDRSILSLLGSAPGAAIYALRASGPNSTDSTIIDAIDRIITLKNTRGGPNIRVCNISLGGPTRFPGGDTLDQAVDALLKNGIVPVVAAGDAGPSALTIASPASSFSALAVGATSPAANDRINWDFFLGLGSGAVFRPETRGGNATQIAWFSARGPNSDGRTDPDVVAAGIGNIGQGYSSPAQIDLGSGTSFAAPIAAGLAAVLVQAHGDKTATQVRNAIIASANPKAIGDGFGVLDRGAGLVDAQAADSLLDRHVPDHLRRPKKPDIKVENNIEDVDDLRVLHGTIRETIRNIKPSQRAEVFYAVEDRTDQVVISISNFSALGPQNASLGVDDLFLMVHSAKTSQIAAILPCSSPFPLFGDYFDWDEISPGTFQDGLGDCNPPDFPDAFTTGGTFIVNDPEPGVMRITVVGDYVNGSAVSADVSVSSRKSPLTKRTAKGKIDERGILVFPVDIPDGIRQATFELSWKGDWSQFPVSDIDFVGRKIQDPSGNFVDVALVPAHPLDPLPGLDAPQVATLTAEPGKTLKKGTWRIGARLLPFSESVGGFTTPSDKDVVELRITLQK